MRGAIQDKIKVFSIIELVITLFVLGILLSLAVPTYRRAIEKSRSKTAEFDLMAIYNAEKRYKLDHNTYYFCLNVPCTAAELENEANLGVYISDPDDANTLFNYSIVSTEDGFTATATRQGAGVCADQVVTVTQSGSQVVKGCEVW